ncbi:Hypothetical predicted protein [Octopus vulgaris]|uniref:Uncharacterized protein n=1 Tax=Octopus vulgaris TaxID=6645 RepID=A0AA36F7A8_OCTVU|nr:Hypothetical predicted protein [Octopus vulgaris]
MQRDIQPVTLMSDIQDHRKTVSKSLKYLNTSQNIFSAEQFFVNSNNYTVTVQLLPHTLKKSFSRCGVIISDNPSFATHSSYIVLGIEEQAFIDLHCMIRTTNGSFVLQQFYRTNISTELLPLNGSFYINAIHTCRYFHKQFENKIKH